MILPILSYGHPTLRKNGEEVLPDYPGLNSLISDMWETLYNAKGCGLAAQQVNHALKLFLVDSKLSYEALQPELRPYYFGVNDTGIKETFINATIMHQSSETWEEEEGCLSIPNLVKPISRPVTITIEYQDQAFNRVIKTFSGNTARMIQHEYDHTRGVLYLDYLKPLARKLLAGKLKKISTGALPAKYPMNYLKK